MTFFGEKKAGGAFTLNGRTAAAVRLLVSAAIAGALSYFALRERVAVAESTEMHHFQEIQRSLSDLKSDVREIREALRK